MAQGRAKGLPGFLAAVGRALGVGHANVNAPGRAHGGGKGAAHGGFGVGHASRGNSTLSSHSQNISHKGETGDGRGVSNHAQDHSDHSNKAGQVAQIDDQGPGEEKGLADSLPGREQQADLGIPLTPTTIRSDLNDIETLEVSPAKQLQPNHVLTVDLKTIHSDLDDIVSRGLKAGQNSQTSYGKSSDSSMTHSDLGGIVSLGLPANQMLQTDRGMILTGDTIDLDFDDIMAKRSRVSFMLNLSRGKSLSPSLQNHLDFGLPDIDDAPVIVRDRWALGADRAKVLIHPILWWKTMRTDGGWFLISVQRCVSFRGLGRKDLA